MKFYNRKQELHELNRLYNQSKDTARMTVITGRRRVGKTMLALEFAGKHKFIYLFVSRKSEHLLCMEYIEEIKKHFPLPVIGDIKFFKDVFALLLDLSKKERFILIIDEFQEFYNVNSAAYSEIQRLWDLNKSKCKMNLICIGSVYSLMHKIFEESKEPLFGRADRILFLKPFTIKDTYRVLSDHRASDMRSLFDCYVLTGGMPKYLDILTSNDALSYKDILNFMLTPNSPFINEGKNLLIEEFGKEYGTYFSILELISIGKTARTEIESVLEIHAGAYLARLENDYALISRHKPVGAKPGSRLQKYKITDNFLNFWFRFIFRNLSAAETENYSYIKEIINRDYSSYSGRILERFFHQIFAETGNYNVIGSYWEKGNQNEIDLLAINDLKKEITMADIKLDRGKINLNALKTKAGGLLNIYSGYKVKWLGLSLEDMKDYLK
ncbi:MAG: ATP-binding protein [Nitrospirae bacterium]|nr:ATP-binding protein [Nitrospirota bacterium]